MLLRRPDDLPRDLDGLPLSSPLELQVSRAVAWIAGVWFALAATWGLFGPMLAGHVASSASVGIIAENMLRWQIPGPVWDYTAARPTPNMYYCHHPWGIFWTTAFFLKFLGRHDFICRLAPVLLSIATPPTLYALGRAVWRPAAGAAAAAAFVVLPIALAFANFNALEVPVMAWSLLGAYGFVRLTQTGRKRFVALALVGSFLSLNADWPAFVFAGLMLAFGLARGFFSTSLFGPMRFERRYHQWWALAASSAVLTFVMYFALFRASGKVDDLLGAYGMRSSGSQAALSAVLESRKYWIELSFTPLAIALGKVGAVVVALRLVILRREHEVLPLAMLAMAVVQYVVFKQGADIHIFWPHYFAAYFALAMGALVATIASALELARPRVEALAARMRPDLAGPVALGVALVPVLAIARDGVPALRYAQESGGRFNEKGNLIHTDAAKTAFIHFVADPLPKTAVVALHEGMKGTWSQGWALGGRVMNDRRPAPGHTPGTVFLADTRFLPSDAQGVMARDYHVTAVGPFWEVVEAEGPAPIDAFSFVETEPSILEWYFVNGTEPHREIKPDPWLTWELRTHFGQPAEIPSGAPSTIAERRIAHNIAVAQGDAAHAAELRQSIERELTPIHATYDDGTEVLGTTFTEGARPLLTIYVLASGPADAQLHVASKVLAKASFSTTMADPTERDVGIPVAIPMIRWRKGFLYADPVPVRKRPGTEVYRMSFLGRSAANMRRTGSGARDLDLLTLR